jgi:hypothetical protein
MGAGMDFLKDMEWIERAERELEEMLGIRIRPPTYVLREVRKGDPIAGSHWAWRDTTGDIDFWLDKGIEEMAKYVENIDVYVIGRERRRQKKVRLFNVGGRYTCVLIHVSD